MARKLWAQLRQQIADAQHSLADPSATYTPPGGAATPVNASVSRNFLALNQMGFEVAEDEVVVFVRDSELSGVTRNGVFVIDGDNYMVAGRSFDDGVRTGYVVRRVL